MPPLTEQDLEDARAQWEEWTTDSGFHCEVAIVGTHDPAAMDPDRPLGVVLKASLSLRIRIVNADGEVVFDEPCPYRADALRASILVLARTIAASLP